MTNSHDFKAARDALSSRAFVGVSHTYECFTRLDNTCICTAGDIDQNALINTIRFALQLAEKVCGEPSDETANAASYINTGELNQHEFLEYVTQNFKAMRDAMIKEIEQGDGQ